MNRTALVVGLAVALAAGVFGVRSCSRRASGVQRLPRGVEYVMRCRTDGFEFRMPPEEINAAFDAGDVRGSGDGNDLFKCPQCGKYDALQTIKGMEDVR